MQRLLKQRLNEIVCKTSEAKRLGTEAQLKAETEIALAKEKELRVQAYKEEEQSPSES